MTLSPGVPMDPVELYKAWELHTEDGTMILDTILGRGVEVTQATILATMEILAIILVQVEILVITLVLEEILVTILVLEEILATILVLEEILASILVEQLQPGDIILEQEEILATILVQVEILATILVQEEIQDLILEEQPQHGDIIQEEDHQPSLPGEAGFIQQLQGQQYPPQGDHQTVKHKDPITAVVMEVDQAFGDRDLCSQISF